MSMASYPGDQDRVTRPMTKPVSGEAIVTSLDRMEAVEHGTKAGYDSGCHGSVCPAVMKCRDVRARYMGDYRFRKALDSGMTVEAFLAAEVAAAEQERVEAVARVKAERAAMLSAKPVPQRAPKPPRERPARPERAARPPRVSGPSPERVAWDARLGELKRRVEVAAGVLAIAREELAQHRGVRPGSSRVRSPSAPRVPVPRARKPHGTNASYTRGCTSPTDCPNVADGGVSCYQAHRDYYREYTRIRQEQGGAGILHGEMQHGTAVGYQYGCHDREGCPGGPDGVTCTDAMLDQDRARRRAKGVLAAPELVDAKPVIDHIAKLREAGMPYLDIAVKAKVGKTTIQSLIWGRYSGKRAGEVPARMSRERAERILAVQP